MCCDDSIGSRRRQFFRWAINGVALLVLLLLLPSEASAIGAFARRYRTSCATCHQAFPRLNAVGEAFRLNGFRFVNDEAYRKTEPPVELGDEAYKKLWPRGLWPTDIPSASPLSFVARMMSENDLDGSREHRVTMLFPEELELVWAGNVGESFSFYGDVIYVQKDFQNGTELHSWAVLKTWLQFQGLLGEHTLNLRLGSVGTQSVGLFNARDANMYATHPYLYTSWEMPAPDLAAAGLRDFKGNHFTLTSYTGLEANGFGKRWLYALGVVAGDLPAAVGGPPGSPVGFWGAGDGGAGDVYAQLAYKIGGLPFDRSGEEPAQALTTGAEFWRDNSTMLSLFGYRGRSTIRAVFNDDLVDEREDTFWRAGAGVQQMYRDLTLSAVWMEGRNSRPFGILSDAAIRSRAWHVEALYQPYPWLLPFARYEALDLDVPAGIPGLGVAHAGAAGTANQDIARLVVGGKALLRPNVALVTEIGLYNKGAEHQEGFDGTLMALFQISF